MNETLTRALSGILYIIILVSATLFLNTFLFLFGVLLLLSVFEFCELIKLPKVVPLLISTLLYLFFGIYMTNPIVDSVLLLLFLLFATKTIYLLFSKNSESINLIEKYGYLIGYIVIPFILLAKLPLLGSNFNPKIIVSLFVLIWVNDTMAYVVGKSIGKKKLFERISPKKTIEGFIGGLSFSVLTSFFIATNFIHQPISQWVFIALIVAVFGTLGDLIESKFKRVARVKDSGRIMPGHGGILDRLDSIIFAGPFVFLFYQISNYVS
jgi:phosphatidate cytidylyltransferase